MNKMYQAVKDFVSPLIYTHTVECENQIVGVLSETRLDDAVNVCFVKTSNAKRGDWDDSNHIKEITFHNNGTSMRIESWCLGHLEIDIIDSSYTIFLQVTLERVSENLVLVALDLETLETYVVNKLV